MNVILIDDVTTSERQRNNSQYWPSVGPEVEILTLTLTLTSILLVLAQRWPSVEKLCSSSLCFNLAYHHKIHHWPISGPLLENMANVANALPFLGHFGHVYWATMYKMYLILGTLHLVHVSTIFGSKEISLYFVQ